MNEYQKSKLNKKTVNSSYYRKQIISESDKKKILSKSLKKIIKEQEEYNPQLKQGQSCSSGYSKKQYRGESWSIEQLRNLFQLYNEVKTRWSFISTKFDNKQLCDYCRSQNCVKNKFYGIIKNTLRSIFKELTIIPFQKMKKITATKLTSIYQGKNQFIQFQGLIKKLLEQMEFKIVQSKVAQFAQKYEKQMTKLYEIIFKEALIKKIKNIEVSNQQQIERVNAPSNATNGLSNNIMYMGMNLQMPAYYPTSFFMPPYYYQ